MKLSIKNIAFLLGLFATTGLMAQDDLPTENVEVFKNFRAQLAETERIKVKPVLPEIKEQVEEQTYFLPTKTLDIDYPAPRIKPLAMKADRLSPKYDGYVKLGAGLPLSTFGELGYNVLAKRKHNFGINLFHQSLNNTNNVENQRFMKNGGKMDYTKYFKQGFAVDGNVGFRMDDYYFYGYNFDETIEVPDTVLAADVRQRFQLFDIGVGIFNGEKTVADFNYKARVDFYNLTDNYASKENGFDLVLQGTKWFGGHSLDVELNTDMTWFEDTIVQTLHNFFLKPAFTMHFDQFKVKAGVNIANHDDEFSFFPDVEASVNILGGQLAAFGGWEGNLQKNNFKNLTDYNPFFTSRFELRNTEYNHYYAGVKGDLKILQYSLQGGFKKANDLALFLPDATPELALRKRFDVVYDTVNIVALAATVTAEPIENFGIVASVAQNIYEPLNEEKAWHLPALEINAGLTYKALRDKLLLRGNVFIENGVPYINDKGLADNLNGLFDVSVGADYYFSKKFGAFLSINNLANNKRQRWQDYETVGINFLGGVSVRF